MKTILIFPRKKPSEWAPNDVGTYYFSGAVAHSLLGAGFTPIPALRDVKHCADIADAILFEGYPNDVNPKLYGEEVDGAKNISPSLDELELAFFEEFYKRGKPMLGICRGIQIINVALGGSLHQNICYEETPFYCHKFMDTQRHLVKTEPGSALNRLFGEEFMTNTYHHQAVKTLGKGLIATARAEDGCIEAVEHENRPIIAVQWHPELTLSGNKFNLPDMSPLFSYFASFCEK